VKKALCLLMCAAVLLFCASAAFSDDAPQGTEPAREKNGVTYTIAGMEVPEAVNQAEILNKLGLFRGTGQGFELGKNVTRAEAVTMALRMIGEEKDAAAFSGGQRFSDVPPEYWAYTNIGYAVEKGYAGAGEDVFEPSRLVTGREFVQMLLTAMGYPEIYYDSAYEAGVKFSLLTNNYAKTAVSAEDYYLLRNDLVNICYCALLTKNADGKALGDLLVEKGVVTKELLNSLILVCNDISESFEWSLNNFMPMGKNYMFSPVSIKIALAMATNGARGETRDEILKVLKIGDLDETNREFEELIRKYAENEDVTLNIANSLWLNTDYYKGVDFRDTFRETVQKHYFADSEKVNDLNAVDKINTWVDGKTNGKITDLVSDNDFLAYIVNTIYFKGEWATQFKESSTEKAEFTDRDGNKTDIDFMNMTDYFDYYEDENFRMIKLPYKDRKTSMYIALPAERGTHFDDFIDKMKRTRLQLSLPKFKTEFDIKLKDILSQLGIKTAFDDKAADFKDMFTETSENIFITDVIHKTFINVDENGTEAAAATGVSFDITSMPTEPPVVFKADRPFTYFIRDDVDGEILFMGEFAYAE
jgi:serine protease inhibitor